MAATPGCKCAQCYGLREWLTDHGHDHRDLPAAPGHATLRVLTHGQPPTTLIALPSDPDPCDGSMCCQCKSCTAERGHRVRNGVPSVRQPWEKAA